MILDDIVKRKKERLRELNLNYDEIAARIKKVPQPYDFYGAMAKEGLSIIGEVKKASPSKGIIRENFNYMEIAKEYENAVDTISVLTEEDFFKGSPKYLDEISKEVKIPTLRKDFIIDDIQIYEARALGASTVLLIAAILDEATLRAFLKTARSLGMEPLVEIHDEEEGERALSAGGKIIGVNNRDLQTFSIDLKTTARLRKIIPGDRLLISESGINTIDDIRALKDAAIDGILVGESFMRSGDIIGKAKEFKSVK